MMNRLTWFWVLSLASLGATGQVAQPISNAVPPSAMSPEDSAVAARLNESVVELKTRSALLQALAEEHLKRSEQATGLNQVDRARWEQELATELHGKNALVSKQLSELRLQQTKFEDVHGPVTSARSGGSAKAEGLELDEIAYLAKLNERWASTEQEIAAAIDQAQTYVLQLQTNNTPEQVQSVSLSLEDNRRTLKDLRKEQSALELKKLEFWAYRRRR